MPTWGTSSAGHYRPRYQEIRDELVEVYKGLFGANRPTTDDTVDGHFISLMSDRENKLREELEATYLSQYLTAAGVPLDQVVALIHTRKLLTYSTVTLTLGGTPTTLIPAGSIVELDDSTAERFVLDADATIGGGGTVDAASTAQNSGPVAAVASSDWTIVTPVTGWDTVTNAADAILGQNQETDPELRTRTREAVLAGGLKAKLLALDGVTAANVLENDTDYTDSLGLPPHSIEAVVQGGTPQEIADTIYANRSDGIQTYGSQSVVVEDVNGEDKTIYYSIPTPVTLHISVTAGKGEGFPVGGDPEQAVKDGIVAYAATYLGVGADVSPFQLANPINDAVAGIATATVKVDDDDPPVTTTVWSIGPREVAYIIEANIDVVFS